ncbi:MAG: PadR family transcriptional regulator [Thermoguttaceae bacterium]|nr:PadR family transcriptional regulator [Thermoguttaceae bacterium]
MSLQDKCACRGSYLDKLIQPAILTALIRGEMYGAEILKRLQKSHAELDPAGFYRTLKKMEDAGLLRSRWEMPSHERPVRVFAMTESGLECLRNWKQTLWEYRQHVEYLLDTMEQIPAVEPSQSKQSDESFISE